MGAFNCIGYNWVGNSYALNTALLRDEWGFKGYIVSDMGAIRNARGGFYSWITTLISGEDSLEETINWSREYVKDVIAYYGKGGAYANILLNSVRANTRHIFNAWSKSSGYIENVEASISKEKAGGYKFDPVTPDEHGYTDIGWYALIKIGNGTLAEGTVKFPVAISGNNGLSAASFSIKSAVPVTDILDSRGSKLAFSSSVEDSTKLNVYSVTIQEANVKISDYDLFNLVMKGATGKPEDYKISLSYSDAIDRLGHSTKLFIGERPVPPPAENRRPAL